MSDPRSDEERAAWDEVLDACPPDWTADVEDTDGQWTAHAGVGDGLPLTLEPDLTVDDFLVANGESKVAALRALAAKLRAREA